MKTNFLVAAGMLAMLSATPAFAATVYNSAPSVGFQYGTGNDYVPANAAVLTGDVNELALRFHQTGAAAPASDANGVYSFALGTTPISFDWDITRVGVKAFQTSLITVTNIGTGQTVSYDPFFVGNDNYTAIAGTAQNSARLNFGFLLGSGFTPNVDSTYRVNLTSGSDSLAVDARLGAGAVPEPATWAMMIVGFGIVGFGLRTRRKQSVRVAYA
jgi:hypothetical protein